ncbi:hypothetical protein [Variovorax sp. HJSM1_2]|uniref:hypothetical protein n=1 Tax=Variovorax sp. HJSM1_2 TaxID=3366263 RepID=UPI003BDA161B
MLPSIPLRAMLVCELLLLLPHAAMAQDPPIASSPLGSEPAVIEYLSNNAPFVVFDIAPRTLAMRAGAKTSRDLALTFVATDALNHVNVFTYVVSKHRGVLPAPTRITCGAKTSGHHQCDVATREALLLLKGEAGLFGLRIEAEGVEGDRSTVRITLPVKAASGKAPTPAVESSQRLSFMLGSY